MLCSLCLRYLLLLLLHCSFYGRHGIINLQTGSSFLGLNSWLFLLDLWLRLHLCLWSAFDWIFLLLWFLSLFLKDSKGNKLLFLSEYVTNPFLLLFCEPTVQHGQ